MADDGGRRGGRTLAGPSGWAAGMLFFSIVTASILAAGDMPHSFWNPRPGLAELVIRSGLAALVALPVGGLVYVIVAVVQRATAAAVPPIVGALFLIVPLVLALMLPVVAAALVAGDFLSR